MKSGVDPVPAAGIRSGRRANLQCSQITSANRDFGHGVAAGPDDRSFRFAGTLVRHFRTGNLMRARRGIPADVQHLEPGQIRGTAAHQQSERDAGCGDEQGVESSRFGRVLINPHINPMIISSFKGGPG